MADEQAAGREGSQQEPTAPSQGAGLRVSGGGAAAPVLAVSEDGVRRALRQDQGSDAHLVSWSRHDFTSKGDNYVSEVTSLSVKYQMGAHTRSASYVVKLRRGGPDSHFDDMVFRKEGRFYTVVVPLLNAELMRAGQEPLRVPRCLHDTWEDNDSQLFMEDLRVRHFKKYDRTKPLSMVHASLAVRELARLHAASVLLLSRPPEEVPSLSFLLWKMTNYSQETNKTYEALISGSLQTASELAGAAGRKDIQEWFSNLAPRGPTFLSALSHLASPFDVITQGDCWVTNMLFREDSQGKPVEVMLMDFQHCCRSSPVLDMHQLFFSSLTAAQRSNCLTHLLTAYYSSFRAVFTATGHVPPFTQEQLTQEFYAKKAFGFIYGSFSVPAITCDTRDAQEFEFTASSEDYMTNYVLKKRERALRMLSSNPLMLPRLLDLYEDASLYAQDTSVTPRDSECLPAKSLTGTAFSKQENQASA